MQVERWQLADECNPAARDIVLPRMRKDGGLSYFPVKVFNEHDAAVGDGIQHVPPRCCS